MRKQIPDEDDPHAFLEKNQPGANHWVGQDETWMDALRECNIAANEAAAAQEAMA